MKSFLFALFGLQLLVGSAQTTITLQPDSSAGVDAYIENGANAGINFGNYFNYAAIAWTRSSNPFVSRGLLRFDFSSIPSNAIIVDAKLTLFCNTNSDQTQLHSSLSGPNASYIERITDPWDEAIVNWNNQPSTSPNNRALLPQSTTSAQDYTDINVSSLVQDMVNNPASSYGFMLKLSTESHYRSIQFASSDHNNASKRPKLVVTYFIAEPCVHLLTIQPDSSNGKDTYIESGFNSGVNYGSYFNYAAIAWTRSGNPFISRSLLRFDLASLPKNALIRTASLNLYCNTTSDQTQLHSSLSGSNECVIEKISSVWNEHSTTWTNQPSTTSNGAIPISQSFSNNQDYLNINVYGMVQEMVQSPESNHGFMLKLFNEASYRSMQFASSDHPDPTKRPKLDICYSLLPTITLQTLNGGEKLLKNTTKKIVWTSAFNTGNVTIRYSLNNGLSWSTAATMIPDTGSYYWAVPDSVSSQCKVIVSSYENPSFADTSNVPFIISAPPTYTIISPNGGEEIFNNVPLSINWTGTNRNNVKVEYSLNDTIWYLINGNVPSNTSTVSWNISNIGSTSVRVRITDNLFPQFGDIMDSVFTIRQAPKFTFSYPALSQNVIKGSVGLIRWTSSFSSSVKLEYSVSNGAWTTLADNLTVNDTSIAFMFNGSHKSDVRFRLSDNILPGNFTISSYLFVFEAPSLYLSSPNGGEYLITGKIQQISWSSSFTDSVNLHYSTNGTSWLPIALNLNAITGSYNWTIPAITSATVRIRISDVRFPQYFDTTDAFLSVRGVPQYTFTTPIAGQKWFRHEIQKINWTHLNGRLARLEVYTDSAAQWTIIADSISSSITSVDYLSSASHKSNIRFRLSDMDAPGTFYQSNLSTIYEKPSLDLSSPNGGEYFISETVKDITWSSSFADSVNIYCSINGQTWSTIATNVPASAGKYSWNIPALNSQTARIKITDVRFPEIVDTSNTVFSVRTAPIYSISLPFLNKGWLKNDTQLISWTHTNGRLAKLEVSDGNNIWIPVMDSIQSSSTSFKYVPVGMHKSTLRFRLSDLDNPTVYFTTANVKVYERPIIDVVTPNGGERIIRGSTFNVTWVSYYSDSVNIHYSIDNQNWLPLALNVNAVTGANQITFQTLLSNNVRIRISDVRFDEFSDVSDTTFAIINTPSLTLTSPNGGEIWLNDAARNITWSSSNVKDINIAYSLNDTVWNTIASKIDAASGVFVWNLPTLNSTNVRVKITDAYFGTYSDASNSVFSILSPPSIQVQSPNGGERLYVDSIYLITWTSINVGNVNVYYTTDNVNWNLITTNRASGNSLNSYTWQVPITLVSTSVKVKVVSTVDSNIYDVSDASFRTMLSTGLISHSSAKNQITVYPNPSNGIMIVNASSWNGSYNLKVMDVHGQCVYEEKSVTNNIHTIQLTHLTEGIYFVRLSGDDGFETIKKVLITQ